MNIPEVVPPTVVVKATYPGRQSQGDRRDGGEPSRAVHQRRRGNALPILAGDRRWRDDADHHLRARDRRRQGAGSGAEPRRAGAAEAAGCGAAPGRHHQQGVSGSHHGGAPGLAGQPLRHAVPVQLRAPARQGRTRAARRGRRRAGVRRGPVLDAHLARSGEGGEPRAHRGRHRQVHPRAEHPGRRGPARGAAAADRHGVPGGDQRQGAPHVARRTFAASS